MQLIVWKTNEWKPIRFGQHAGQGNYMRIVLKRRDGEKGSIYLNLPDSSVFIRSNEWIPYMKEGNIIDCQLQANGNNVNYFQPFTVIQVKEVNKQYIHG